MSRYHSLAIKNITKETLDAVSITFEVPAESQANFQFIQGQYVTLRLPINGENVVRSYSICSSPFVVGSFSIGIKKVEGGKASGYLNDNLRVGDIIEVMEPNGRFYTALDPAHEKHYYLFGGGSGITPMFSIIKAVIEKEPKSKLTLFYGNRNEESIIFRRQLDSIAIQLPDQLKIVHVLSETAPGWTGYQGLMNKETNLKLIKENSDLHFQNAEFFICGPGVMMSEAKAALLELGVPTEKIHIEYFTAKENTEDAKPTESGTSDQPEITSGKAKVKIKYDGNVVEFEMNVKHTVLDAALDAGYDPPYSCMVAACCTCRAKLVKGKVHMDDRESLTDSEINDGYVLTCQSHPRTEIIELDYDI